MSACDEVIFQNFETTMTLLAAPSQTKIDFRLKHQNGFALNPSVSGGRGRWDEEGPTGSRKIVIRTAAAGLTEKRLGAAEKAWPQKTVRRGGRTGSKGAFGGRPEWLPQRDSHVLYNLLYNF